MCRAWPTPAGTVQFAPNLPGLVGTALSEAVAKALPGWSVWIGNDATAACWAEHDRGAARGADEVVMVTLGTGIGGGIISGGKLIEGSNRYAGEFGHMVVDPHGPRCPCGKRGCWERFASGSGLGRLGREMAIAGGGARRGRPGRGRPRGGSGRARHGSPPPQGDGPPSRSWTEFAWWVALGLANLANALDPELIVVGGGLVAAGDVLIGPTRRAFAELVEAPYARVPVRIVAAQLGRTAGGHRRRLLAATPMPGP